MSDSTTTVRRFDDAAALVAAAADDVAAVIAQAQADRGFASIVLTGGSNGNGVAAALRDRPIDWSTVDVFFGDERFVADRSADRNELQTRGLLLDHVPVDPDNVYRFPAADEFSGDATLAAQVYAQRLAQNATRRGNAVPAGDGIVPQFDVHLLGMGGEGHINSLFPHTDAVRERKLPVVPVHDSPKPPPNRLTLTLPAVGAARRVWLLVSGAEKAEAVAAGVGGANPDDWPCAGAHGSEETVWYLDPAAASQLP
ncbi:MULTISPECIES: 6-phosphogluconolactonase [Tsukamurella]|uniref:6-phosphogluconolactonase n=1 Tax=Tsukamurella strandjordii TaxID=147577 RepID=A0AA90NK52_9ACTN|nr:MULTISPECIES: 6-phosphogluconolactonase [Tsukamurella]MDP0399374.1 6-phosphogluconolactonase [Tsukamurella strandjordii]GIZ95539.1 6-phosphogluconolactonase [Tsukamurella sp. TY48]